MNIRPVCYWPKRWQRRLGVVFLIAPIVILGPIIYGSLEAWRIVREAITQSREVWSQKEPFR